MRGKTSWLSLICLTDQRAWGQQAAASWLRGVPATEAQQLAGKNCEQHCLWSPQHSHGAASNVTTAVPWRARTSRGNIQSCFPHISHLCGTGFSQMHQGKLPLAVTPESTSDWKPNTASQHGMLLLNLLI